METKKDQDFYALMEEILPQFQRKIFARLPNVFAQGTISVPHIFILETLDKQDCCTMGKLADSLSISTSAVTGHIDRMIRSGLVERARDSEDRRVVKVTLTKKGSNLVKKIREQRRNMLGEIFSQISREERQKYLEIIQKIYRRTLEKEK